MEKEKFITELKNTLSKEKNPDAPPTPGWKKFLAVIFLIIAIIYDISPVDGDAIPIIGWIDDISITMLAFTNFLEKFFQIENETLNKFLRIVKVILVSIFLIFLSIFGFILYGCLK